MQFIVISGSYANSCSHGPEAYTKRMMIYTVIDTVEYTVEPPIKDPPRKGQPPYKGHSSRSLFRSINTFLTSEKRTTSEIRTEAVSPKCPLFEGSL